MSSTYYSEDCDGSHVPLTEIAAFFDCARYNDANDAETVREYLQAHPLHIDATDDQGRTAMHMAAANNHTSIMNVLFAFQPQPDRCNADGNTALHFAALNNALAAAELLLSHGWSADRVNQFHNTPLQLIQNKNFTQMEMLLLAHETSIDSYPVSVSAPEHAHDEDVQDHDDSGQKVVSATSNPSQSPPQQMTYDAQAQSSQGTDDMAQQMFTSIDDVE